VPPAFVAVTVKTVEDVTTVGVPDISPFVVEKASPAGSVGDIDQETTAPPPDVGLAVDINTFVVKM
jgi:hypothetical protein